MREDVTTDAAAEQAADRLAGAEGSDPGEGVETPPPGDTAAGAEEPGAGVAAPAEGAAADLAAARAEADAYLNDLLRLKADFENYRKRMLREQTALAGSASQALVTKLLPVLDNFELAVSAAEQSQDFGRMLKGVEMVFGELREVLRGEGLAPIEAQGALFDPSRHEAVIAVEQPDVPEGTVLDVVRSGYELQGKVLRPAMVKVARAPEPGGE